MTCEQIERMTDATAGSGEGALAVYLAARRAELEGLIAAEALAGNEYKESMERSALAEITILECESRSWIEAPCDQCAELRAENARLRDALVGCKGFLAFMCTESRADGNVIERLYYAVCEALKGGE